MNNLSGKKAVVTGGAMGIGLETTRRLLKEGVDVTVWDMNESAFRNVEPSLRETGRNVYFHTCDVSDKERVFELSEIAKQEMGRVDILINNAGFVKTGRFCDQPIENAISMTDVNLNAIYYTTYAFLPDMYKRNSGHIVNISSAGGLIGVPDISVYCATKFAVLGFTESLRFEAVRDNKKGVKFSSVHPNFIKEGMFEGGSLNFLGNLIVPGLKNHDVIAEDIIEKALKRNRGVIKRPKSLQLSLFLRSILPNSFFCGLLRIMGINRGMEDWVGRPGSAHASSD